MNARKNVLMAVVMTLTLGVIPALADEEDHWPVLIGSDGSIKFQPPLAEKVSYTPSGMEATLEAMKHPEAIKRLITEKRDFLPIQFEVVDSRMVGLLTWRVTKEAKLVLTRSSEGILDIRPPANEVEKERKEEDLVDLFGLFATMFFILLLFANILATRRNNTVAFAFVVVAAFAFAAAFVVVAAFAVAAFAFAAAAFAFAAAAFAFAAAIATPNAKLYHILSGIAAILMLIAVLAAIC